MSDLNHQQLATVQSNEQPAPATLASATTIAPSTFITYVSGTTDITTITPYVTGAHMICLIFTDATPGDILTTGNVTGGSTTLTQNVPVLAFWSPTTQEWLLK